MTHDEMIAIITAYKEGKQIQFKLRSEGEDFWVDSSFPGFNFIEFDYRIKPEPPKPKYSYFSDASDCLAEVKKHGGWVKRKRLNFWFSINGVSFSSVEIGDSWIAFVEFFDNYVWADDGSPCGILEE